MASQVVEVPVPVRKLPGRSSDSVLELVFKGIIPPLGFTSFYVSKRDDDDNYLQPEVIKISTEADKLIVGDGVSFPEKRNFSFLSSPPPPHHHHQNIFMVLGLEIGFGFDKWKN